MGATEIILSDFWAEFHEDAEFEVKSAVASYFGAVFLKFVGPNVWSFFAFSGCETPQMTLKQKQNEKASINGHVIKLIQTQLQ